MPLVGFLGPSGEKVDKVEAPLFFEHQGLVPAEVIQLMLKEDRSEPTRFLSPSRMIPETNCRRQFVLEKFLPYHLDPMRLWTASEGTIWHKAFASTPLAGWLQEHTLPDPDDADKPGVKRCEDGELRVEVFPGIWLRGTLDRPRPWITIVDHKTSRWSRTDYSGRAINEWEVQVNIYRAMMEKLKGERVEELWVWRTYRGGYINPDNPIFRKLPVRRIGDEELWDRIGQWTLDFLGWVQRAADAYERGDLEQVKAVVAEMPMDGEPMFNGSKCQKYCSRMEECFQIQGVETF